MYAKPIVLQSDALRLPLADDTVDLVVTSPPYWGQRIYTDLRASLPGQHGMEATPAEFVAVLVAATREWVRVLKPTGSIWVNLGDKYENRGLLGLPWRYAIACVDTLGLTLRAEVIWHKPTSLPESQTDRVSRGHEQWFHFVLTPNGYYADLDPIRVERVWNRSEGYQGHKPRVVEGQPTHCWTTEGHPAGKVPSSVWTVPTEPFKAPTDVVDDEGHTAAPPTELPRRIVTGWSPPAGVVLDPYAGTGTTGHVAAALGRTAILVDRSAAYTRLAASPELTERRIRKVLTGKPTAPGRASPPDGQDALFEVA